ncbi:Maltose/galactoside acetyltransferase [Penicillium pulvis]|uniref:Maltose/galactoside acetyltransferase n=1 Tax=Penicillium pulvis TaxID=1562058 RepID=UPI002548B399|nr:Maltose/galactoside acetyltransferase [Penicillium pulvis]KAJ5784454.1 Maltose/galactoside acetyltransferase [Penicillium pulvis]
MTSSKEWAKMLRGELYMPWDEDLQANRTRCKQACDEFNTAGNVSRRRKVELWRNIIGDTRPLPPVNPDPKEDEELFDETDPVVDGPISVDHGLNFKVGAGTFLNFNLLVLDTCLITIGERVLFGPNVSLYGAIHPLDPAIRQGMKGPEAGKEIHIEDDVWIGGSVMVLAGVRIGKGCTIGAGSVVTRDVPPFHFAAGNPARVIKRIESKMDPEQC